MKINLISNSNNSKASIDNEVLRFLFKKIKDNVELVSVNVLNYECPNASINIFIRDINYSFVNNAKINVFIADHENLADFNINYLNAMDYIFCKTEYSKLLLENAMSDNNIPRDNLILTGWRSPNIEINTSKSFNDILLYCSDRNNSYYSKVLEDWKDTYPTINVVSFNKKRKEQSNIKYHDNIKTEEFHKLFNKCGLHLILEEKTSFSHLINQAKQVKSIPIATMGGSNKDILDNDIGFIISCKKKKSNDAYYGSRFIPNLESLYNKIEEITRLNEDTLSNIGNEAYGNYMQQSGLFESTFKNIFKDIFTRVRNTKRSVVKELSDEELPTISIITPTYNRYNMFKLAIYNFNTIDYPRNKIEWIIIDDSDTKESIENLLPPDQSRVNKYNIHYIKLNEKHTIGEKRNMGIRASKNDIIVCMDDDDYYHPKSILNRINILLSNKNKKCIACTTIATFEINKIISMINVPSISDTFETRVSPATLIFYKEFFDEDHSFIFDDANINECKKLISGRIGDVIETNWKDNIVSLLHKNNASKRTSPQDQESNGCHFNFNEKLFKFIISLDKT